MRARTPERPLAASTIAADPATSTKSPTELATVSSSPSRFRLVLLFMTLISSSFVTNSLSMFHFKDAILIPVSQRPQFFHKFFA